MNTAFIFPGQGSQIVGMGKDFFTEFNEAKIVFETVDHILGRKLSDVIFNSQEDLTLTMNTQPALMTVSIAIMHVMMAQTGKKITEFCSYVGGHSLGEYSALCASNAISLEDTAKLLHIRGESMHAAAQASVGSMAACIGVDAAKLENFISENITQGVCQIANDNVEGQIVISGHDKNIDIMINVLKLAGFKAIKLKVSGAFHSVLMKPAEQMMRDILAKTVIKQPEVPVICNVNAKYTLNTEEIKNNLIKQICGAVRWRETMNELHNLGVKKIVEIGAGKVLSNLVIKSGHNFQVQNISNIMEMQQFLESLV